jgi:hypothetical protein
MSSREPEFPPPFQQAHLCEALERLVRLYDATGKKEQAAKWREALEATKPSAKK